MELIQIDGLIAITTQEPDTFKLEWLSNLFQNRDFWIAISIITLVALLKYYSSTRKSLLFLQPGDRDYIKKNNHQTLTISAISVLISFSVPLWLNLSISKESTGAQILQSLLTVSGGLVLLLTFMENRRKNDIDELKNLDESIQKLHTNRHERNTKSIELMFSSNTPAAVSAVYSLCNIADEWANEATNSENENEHNNHKEAQSIINVLCTYIREYGKEQENPPQQEIYNKLVCKTILEELSNRLNILDKGYSKWNDYKINLKGTTFTFPIELEKIGNTNNIDISECTFKDNLRITIAADKNSDTDSNETGSRVLSLEGCVFNSSVSIGGHVGAEISEINLQNTHFKEKSRLKVCDLSFKNSPSPSTSEPSTHSIYIHGTQPHEMVFSDLSDAAIVVGQKYDSRDPNNSGAIQYTTIQGNILIEQCDDTSFEIPDRHTFNGEINIFCSQKNINEIKMNDCILKKKVIIKAANIKEMGFIDTRFNRGLDIDCSEKIETLTACDAFFYINGSISHQGVDLINSKSKVTIKAKYITLLNLSGTNFYTPLILEVTEIEKMEARETKFHVKPDLSKTKTIKNHDFLNCEYYDSNQKKYIPLTHP